MLSAAVAGEFRPCLLQIHFDTTRVAAGDRSLILTYWWRNTGDAQDGAEERVFVHIRRQGEAESAVDAVRRGADHNPPIPMQRWPPGRVITYTSAIHLDGRMPPGDYLILAGIFDPDTGRRRELAGPPAAEGDEYRYIIGRLQILPEGTDVEPSPATQTFVPLPAPGEEAGIPLPEQTVTLGNDSLKVILDRESPCILAWKIGDAELKGDPEFWPPEIRVLSLADNRVRLAESRPYSLGWQSRQTGNGLFYHGSIQGESNERLEFDLSITLYGTSAEIVLANVVETGACRLLSVRFPHVVSAGTDGAMALPWNGGRLVTPGPWARQILGSGLGWSTQMQAGVLYNSCLLCAADLSNIDSRIVAETNPAGVALGVSLEHCAPAKPGIPPLRLGTGMSMHLRFCAPENRPPTWTDGAILFRNEITARPPGIYENTLIYKIFCDSPGAKSFTTFDQAVDLIRRYGNLIDGAPQVVYLVGWQHTGHDTGYPDVFTVNPRLGGRERLVAAIESARQDNAVLSFHDNYDDAYETSPAWNPELVSRDQSGALRKGGVWAGGQSYIQSFSATATAAAVERVRRTLAFLPIRTSYHIDVLSAIPDRLDFSPDHPASGEESLAGKRAIIHAFNEGGVDVTSEGMCAPFVGIIGHAWHLIRKPQTLFTGEKSIPFAPFVYHGRVTYGGGRATDEDIPETLLYGATFSADFNRSTSRQTLADSYYLIQIPFQMLRPREMTDYRETGGIRRVEYGPDTYVECGEGSYRVVIDGRLISADFTTFAPNWRGDAWLAFSRKNGTIEYDAPGGWTDPQRVKAVALTESGPGKTVPVTLADGRLQLRLSGGDPCRVSYQ